MVIIAIAFTLFPKILQVTAKVNKNILKEEALSNEIALVGLIRTLAWDEHNTHYDDILDVQNGANAYQCGVFAKIYRQGGFVGSRNCEHHINASVIGSDGGDSLPDDIDDFHGVAITSSNFNNTRTYRMHIQVHYVKDFAPQQQVTLSKTYQSTSSNVKLIEINATPMQKQEILGQNIATLYYYASNIGQLQIKRMPWKK
ncbi:hypothetical protein NitYY0918_C1596 [Nitratiruptor sp. YY09-18]|nr:hypothetical protein NitYY0918_C1596 [Nitratiruptor sp. YY09-18]